MLKMLAGDKNMSIDDLAKTLGISKTTIYNCIHDFCPLYEKIVKRDISK
jgi:AcrR family transcriptional regulator